MQTIHVMKIAHIFVPRSKAAEFFAFLRDTNIVEEFDGREIVCLVSALRNDREIEGGNKILAVEGLKPVCEHHMVKVMIFRAKAENIKDEASRDITVFAGEMKTRFDEWLKLKEAVQQAKEQETAAQA